VKNFSGTLMLSPDVGKLLPTYAAQLAKTSASPPQKPQISHRSCVLKNIA
jgi:hypothetical protein